MSTDTSTTTEATKAPRNDNPKMNDDSKAMSESKSMTNDTKANDDIDLIAVMMMCNESFHIEMSYLISLNESGSFPDETDKTPKCFLRCVLQSLKVASLDDGKIDPERAAAIFADERDGGEDIVETATFCAQRDEKCHCEMAYNFLKCLFSMQIEKYGERSKSKA
nr:odorant binding protein 13 [Apocheima cinerarius]